MDGGPLGYQVLNHKSREQKKTSSKSIWTAKSLQSFLTIESLQFKQTLLPARKLANTNVTNSLAPDDPVSKPLAFWVAVETVTRLFRSTLAFG